jgi:ABC-2 type transport system ATP-binding protein
VTAVVSTDGLTKRYDDVLAVDGVNLRLEAGQIYALLRLNGAGKTTMIRMLLGLVRPSSGTATVLGSQVVPGLTSPWARVGHLVETPAAYPELTVRENLTIARRLLKVADLDAVDDVIELLSLTANADRQAGKLSLGNSQRLGLAKALVHRPDLLILDEPTNGLDPAGVVEVRQLLRNLAARHGVTILLSSHLLAEVARTAGRIGVLHQGRLIQEFDTADLGAQIRARLLVSAHDLEAAAHALAGAGYRSEPTSASDLSISDPGAVEHPDAIATLMVAAGRPPTRLQVEKDDLETHFLRLVGHEGVSP